MTRHTLPTDTTAPGVARAHAGAWARSAGWTAEQATDLVIVVSELAANAVRHGRPPVFLTIVAVAEEPGSAMSALVTVVDHGQSTEPTVQHADVGAGNGRGLAMVKLLSSDSGWRRTEGRTEVWARVRPPAA